MINGGNADMKITEMKNCIEIMRECYKFDDDKTEIRLTGLGDNFCHYIGGETRCLKRGQK
jgi:hypothetical protein